MSEEDKWIHKSNKEKLRVLIEGEVKMSYGTMMCLTCGFKKHGVTILDISTQNMLDHTNKISKCCEQPSYFWMTKMED